MHMLIRFLANALHFSVTVEQSFIKGYRKKNDGVQYSSNEKKNKMLRNNDFISCVYKVLIISYGVQ